MWIARWLRSAEKIPASVQLAILFYLAHLLCEGWIGSSQGFLALSAATTIVALFRKELRLRGHPLFTPLVLFVIASTISALLSPEPVKSLFQVSEWFLFLSFPLGLTLYRRVPNLIPLALTCLLILAIFQGTYGLVQYAVLGHRQLENRITGTTAHVMTYSGLLLPLSLVSIVFALERRNRLAILAALLSTTALVFTFTRGAWIGWLAGAIALLSLRRPRWLAYAVPVLLLAVTFSPLPFFGRLVSTFDVQQSSNLDRIRMVQAGVEMVKDNPFFGVGPANIKEVYPLYRMPDAPRFRIPHLHNNLIQIWAERGLLALIAYLLLVGTFITLCVKARRADPQAGLFADFGLAVAVGLFVAGFFEFNFGDSEVLVLMIDLFALAAAGLETLGRTGNEAASEAVVP